MRVFVSIDIPGSVRKDIVKVQKNLPPFSGKKTSPENLHLTLKFLGEIGKEKVEKVKERLREVRLEKFEAKADLLGVFSPKFVRIVWLHLAGCDELQKKVDESLKGLFEPERRFMSHLTIARVKNLKDRKKFLDALREIDLSEISFKVKKFYLKESVLTPEGPQYKTIEEYDLD